MGLHQVGSSRRSGDDCGHQVCKVEPQGVPLEPARSPGRAGRDVVVDRWRAAPPDPRTWPRGGLDGRHRLRLPASGLAALAALVVVALVPAIWACC